MRRRLGTGSRLYAKLATKHCNDALAAAINHSEQMEAMARAAMEMLAELEAENGRLRAACQQRQEVIDILKTRGRT